MDSLEILGSSGNTDPFDSIYGLVYRLTTRTVGCREIAESKELLDKSLQYFEDVHEGLSPSGMIFPAWVPTPANIKKAASGARLYFMVKGIVAAREKEGRREDDPLQMLLDKGDDAMGIVDFTMGALMAGQLNSGINAAWVLAYLGAAPEWLFRARQEVDDIMAKHGGDDGTFADKVKRIPLSVWESGSPTIDVVFKESMRFDISSFI